jgi:hypothetical protein
MVLRSGFLFFFIAAALAAILPAQAKDPREIVISEPIHQLVYLPLYAAIDEGYFAEEGLSVHMITIAGTAPINAVLSKQAFAFMGGPEHNAYIKIKGGELRSVAEIVDRANTYLVAKKGLAPTGTDYAGFVRGKRFATPAYGIDGASIPATASPSSRPARGPSSRRSGAARPSSASSPSPSSRAASTARSGKSLSTARPARSALMPILRSTSVSTRSRRSPSSSKPFCARPSRDCGSCRKIPTRPLPSAGRNFPPCPKPS